MPERRPTGAKVGFALCWLLLLAALLPLPAAAQAAPRIGVVTMTPGTE